jgi:hypothetical protein
VKASPLPAATWELANSQHAITTESGRIHAGMKRVMRLSCRGLAGAESVRESLHVPWVFLLLALGGGPRWRVEDGGQSR